MHKNVLDEKNSKVYRGGGLPVPILYPL